MACEKKIAIDCMNEYKINSEPNPYEMTLYEPSHNVSVDYIIHKFDLKVDSTKLIGDGNTENEGEFMYIYSGTYKGKKFEMEVPKFSGERPYGHHSILNSSNLVLRFEYDGEIISGSSIDGIEMLLSRHKNKELVSERALEESGELSAEIDVVNQNILDKLQSGDAIGFQDSKEGTSLNTLYSAITTQKYGYLVGNILADNGMKIFKYKYSDIYIVHDGNNQGITDEEAKSLEELFVDKIAIIKSMGIQSVAHGINGFQKKAPGINIELNNKDRKDTFTPGDENLALTMTIEGGKKDINIIYDTSASEYIFHYKIEDQQFFARFSSLSDILDYGNYKMRTQSYVVLGYLLEKDFGLDIEGELEIDSDLIIEEESGTILETIKAYFDK